MRFIFTIAFVLIIAVIAGLFIYQDPGYMFISYKTWGVEMPLWLAVVLAFLSFIILLLLFKIIGFLIHLPQKVSNWRARKGWNYTKINSNLSLLAICDEDWSSVKKHADKAIKLHDQFLMNYILAGLASYQQKDDEGLNHYFHLAQKNIPDAQVFISLIRAWVQWQNGHLEVAKNILLELYSHFSSKKLVVRWLYQVCLESQDWHHLEKILPAIEDTHVLDKEKLHELEGAIYLHRLHNLSLQEHSDLNEFWSTVPRYLKKESKFVAQYIESLIQHGQNDLAWKLLVNQLKVDWNDHLVALISQIHLSDTSSQLSIAEKWLHQHADDPNLLLQLGKLCMRLSLWGKARDYFEKAIKIKPIAEHYMALAKLHESLHETEQALNCYRLAFQTIGENT